ncbi:MAG: TetR/AcrR family transcriptional regulator [Coriobacteriia bacterium]|nr:TetR/AcrR family transcriptional regulator [Coriobacteriia bacterium]MBS5477607.1 TetR/AcrR family transcriptional regulator [Coriobacteriia bacterium]
MTARKIDRRIERTRAAITQAMGELMREQDYDDITVTQIAQRAGVDRKTFYLHYPSKDALVRAMEHERAERLLGLTHEIIEDSPVPPVQRMTTLLNAVVDQDADLHRRIALTPSYSFLLNDEKAILKQAILDVLASRTSLDPDLRDLYADFCAGGMMSTYVAWVQSGEQVSRERLIKLLLKAMCEGAGIPFPEEAWEEALQA